MFRGMQIPEPGPRVPRRGGPRRTALGRAILRLTGWRIDNAPPDQSKLVILAAPHSSNWDFIVGLGLVFALRLDIRFIGKAELFRGPLGPLMRRLGGLAVDRRRPEGFVEQTVALFEKEEGLRLGRAARRDQEAGDSLEARMLPDRARRRTADRPGLLRPPPQGDGLRPRGRAD